MSTYAHNWLLALWIAVPWILGMALGQNDLTPREARADTSRLIVFVTDLRKPNLMRDVHWYTRPMRIDLYARAHWEPG
eukprot:SAG11_NODE_7995_length_1072_cov_1.285714_1_plen_78_part_00